MTAFRRHSVAAMGATTILAAAASAGHIDAALNAVLKDAAPDEIVSALAYLVDQADADGLNHVLEVQGASRQRRHETVIRELRGIADSTQGPVLQSVATAQTQGVVRVVRPYWLANVIRVDATPDALRTLADHPEVDVVFLNPEVESIGSVSVNPAPALGPLAGATDSLESINVPEVWALGFDGTGVLVSIIDSGVDGAHPAIASRWAGVDPAYAGNPEWAWHDPYLGLDDFPYDDNGHGTHVLGTVCGGFPGDQIGVAPGAKWISSAAIDRGGDAETTIADLIEAMQWVADPDGDPATSWDVPATCSNSWGLTTALGAPACDTLFWSFTDNLEAAGIAVLYSAGNEGSVGLRRPADRATDEYRNFAVAAVNGNTSGTPIALFSSRGPTTCTPTGELAFKPDIAAPGVQVRSAAAGGGYETRDGTSMAAPHVNGVLAMMTQANPNIGVDQLKQILIDTAVDLGEPGDDNAYGHGLIDALAAVEAALATAALTFNYPAGVPVVADPNGGTVFELVVSGAAAQPIEDSATLHVSVNDGPYTVVPLSQSAPNVYNVPLGTFECGADVKFYLSASLDSGQVATDPFDAPLGVYQAVAHDGIVTTINDNFENDLGWTVVSDGSLTDGAWERGIPAGGGDRGDPIQDDDGSGHCWVTDNEDGNSDVDGGPTWLVSPPFDLSDLSATMVSYSRWFTNDDLDVDALIIEISNDDGASWTPVDSVGHLGYWQRAVFRVDDYIEPTAEVRIRFGTNDTPNDSITEAGIDGVSIRSFYCEPPPIPGDVDHDGDVDFEDIVMLLASWGPCPPPCAADFNGSGVVDFEDLLILLAAFGSTG